ncbi:MAG: molybdate transport system ATP-binding protein [Actinomycetota bacterium]|nr:molybdate transport system ATP-binding protein [Actinomycetota bacterium]
MSLEAHIKLRLGALDLDAEIAVADGEVVAIVGPNGSGKTSVMRALAGLVPLSGGRIVLDGEVLEDSAQELRVPPERRPVGFVFQDYLLFPHLSALENVAFGLRCRGMPRSQARDRAREWLNRMGLASHVAARPRALSGGQAQRVALARALATAPRLLLLDEPTAALDAGAKVELRREIRRHLATFQGTRLLVTHDPLEAATLADRLVVLEAGRVVQSGTPVEVSERPRSQYVAELVGINLLRGRADGYRVVLASGGSLVVATQARGEVFAVVHPRAVALHARRPEGSARNVWHEKVMSLDLEGSRVRVRMDGEVPLVGEVTPAAVADLGLAEGEPVWASVKATEVNVYPA